eukprot:COSAG03_NODE_30317_length_163_cov_72.015625_1_plen_32_part_10
MPGLVGISMPGTWRDTGHKANGHKALCPLAPP